MIEEKDFGDRQADRLASDLQQADVEFPPLDICLGEPRPCPLRLTLLHEGTRCVSPSHDAFGIDAYGGMLDS